MSAADPDDPAGTNDEAEALTDEATGRPVPNPIRNVAFQANALRSALLSSALAFHLAELGMGVGVFLIATGFFGLGFLWLIRLS